VEEEWIDNLARDVHVLICEYNAMPRFRAMVKKYDKARAAEANAGRKWERLRHASLSNVAHEPRLRDRQAGPPEPGWVWLNGVYEDRETFKRGSGRSPNMVEGWVPPGAAESCRPKRTTLVGPVEPLPLEYKYARLAAIHDATLTGLEKVWPPGGKLRKGKVRPDITYYAYYVLMRDTVNLSGYYRPDGERALFQAFLIDVKADLMAASAPGRQSKGKPNDGNIAADLQNTPRPTDSDIDRVRARQRKKIKWLAEAMSLVQTRPFMSDAAIALAVKKHPSTLSRNETYKQAAKLARDTMNIPKGSKTAEGAIEAIDESPEDSENE